jgi:hypothetical protein
MGAGIAQSVLWMAAGWMTEGSKSSPGWGKILHVAQTGSGAHPLSYQMGTEGSFPGGKAVGK